MDVSRYQVVPIEMNRIFHDRSFNCRGFFSREECEGLAESVKERGLDYPIQVQPWGKDGFDFRIVSGHRRYVAFQINGASVIPCVVRNDIVDEMSAKDANLVENLQRADLNLLQEAKSLSYYFAKGCAVNDVAKRLGMSNGWVEIRRRLIQLPPMVQEAAENRIVTQGHINQLWAYRNNPEKMSQIISQIKMRHEAGEKNIVIREEVKIKDFAAVRRPKPHEVDQFIDVINDMVTQKIDANEYFAHKVLCWCMGYISQAELYAALKRECARLDVDFSPPTDVARIFESVSGNT
jgi:ParB/RepB/Spo0J family partition protein